MSKVKDVYLDMVNNVTEMQPLSSAEGYANIVSRRRYSLNALLGTEMDKHLHLGHTLRANIYGKKIDQGTWHGGAGFTTQSEGTNTVFKLTSTMAYHYNYIRHNEAEVEDELNPKMGEDYLKMVFGDTLKGKMQNAHQSNCDALEDALWAPADQAAMVTNGTRPMSIPYLISEAAYLPLQADESSVTAVYNATEADLPTYDNARYTYAALGGNAVTGEDLLGELDQAWLNASFEPIPEHPEFGPGNKLTHVVFCSSDGIKKVLGALRNGQTQWGKREMTPYGVRIDNMLFKPISALDTAFLYAGGGGLLCNEAGVDSAGSTVGGAVTGPRYYGVNIEKTKLFFEQGHFQRMESPVDMTPAGQPYDFHQNIKTKCQLWCPDRRSNFIVSPATDF